jgi:tetratricopeptide (TPR) repeat protein
LKSAALVIGLLAWVPALYAQQNTAADSAWTRGDVDTAFRLYEARLARDSSDAVALHRVGLVKAWNQDLPGSLKLLDRALRIEGTNTSLIIDRARVLGWSRRFDEALSEAERVLAGAPENVDALELKATILTWTGKNAEALALLDRLQARMPNEPRIALAQARVLNELGRKEEASAKLRIVLAADSLNAEARALDAQMKAVVTVPAGQKLSWNQQFDSAAVIFNSILATDPNNVEALLALAANYRYQGANADARRVLKRVEAIDPNNPDLAKERAYLRGSNTPLISPSFSYVSDSDGNRISSIGAEATSAVGSKALELRVGGSHKDFSQEGHAELDQKAVNAQVGVATRSSSGWRVSGTVGIWQAQGDSDRRVTTSSLGVSSPYSKSFQAGVSFSSALYDVTALVVENAVKIRELRADATMGADTKTTFALGASAARFEGSDENTRLLGSARLSQRLTSTLTAGPAVRYFRFSKDLNDGYWDPDNYSLVELPIAWVRGRGPLIPSFEIAPGYQHIGQQTVTDPWSVSFRAQAGLAYMLGNRRQIGVQGFYANSGLSAISPIGDSSYRYRAVTVYGAWSF